MNQFFDQIKVKLLDRKFPGLIKMGPFDVDINESIKTSDFSVINEYKIEINWKCEFKCKSEDVNFMEGNCILELKDFFFQDERKSIHRLKRFLYEENLPAAKEELHKLEKLIR